MPRTLLSLSVFLAACLTTSAAAGPTDVIRCNPLSPGHTFIESLLRVDTPYGNAGYLIDRPGHYLVTNDLDASAFDFGILVTSPGVTLDLGGHTLYAQPMSKKVLSRYAIAGVPAEGRGFRTNLEATPIASPSNRAIIGMRGASLLLRNGTLRPLTDGVDAQGVLVVDHIDVLHASAAPNSHAIVSQSAELTIASSRLQGAAVSVSVVVPSEGMLRVFDSRIEGGSKGLEILGSGFGHVQGSTISGETALFVSGSVSVTHNMIRGGVRVIGESGWFEDNDLIAMNADHALIVEGYRQIVSKNRIRGGRLAAINVTGAGNRVSSNRLQTRGRGILVGGESNLIERNNALVPASGCGVEFTTADTHVYRDNVVRLRATPVCGEPNTEATTSGDAEPPVPLLLARPRLGVPCAPPDAVLLPDGIGWTGSGPIVIDQPGYYLLTRDLHFADDGGLTITSPGVVLDLGGFMVGCNACRRLVQASGGGVTVLNGTLDGGDPALGVSGGGFVWAWNLSATCHLLHSGGCSALQMSGLEEVMIEESAIDYGGAVSASRVRIAGTNVDGVEAGLFVDGSIAAHVEGSRFQADWALTASAGASIVGNYVSGRTLKYRSTTVLRHNIINTETTYVEGEGAHFEDNIVGTSYRLYATGDAVVSRNSIFSLRGVRLSGSNLLQDNLILATYCGVELEDCEPSQALVDNVVLDAGEGICGPPAHCLP